MKHRYIAAVALLGLAGLPVVAQRVVRVQRSSTAPVVADFESSSAHSYLGVGVADLSNDRVQALKLKDDRGVEITQVDQDAPAGKAGLKEHDVIVAFNGTPVESQEQFKRLMRETPPGRTVSLDILRDGHQQSVKVQLADRKKLESSVFPHDNNDFAFVMPSMPPMPAMPDFPRSWPEQTVIRVRSNAGLMLESLTSQLGDYFGVKNGEGMLVRSVQKGSPAEAAGVRAGDVVVRVGDQKITDTSDWRSALRNSKDGKVAVVIVREKKEQTLYLTVPERGRADSSTLYQEECPESAIEDAERAVEQAVPLAEEGIQIGAGAAGQALSSPEVQKAMREAMRELHRELIADNGELNRNLRDSMKVASAELKQHSAELKEALREAQRNLDKIRVQYGTEMQ